jgi:hypothetical protein
VTESKPGGRTLTYSYRWLEGVPLRDGGDALHVNWVGVAVAEFARLNWPTSLI